MDDCRKVNINTIAASNVGLPYVSANLQNTQHTE
jgi:hypothetical protein